MQAGNQETGEKLLARLERERKRNNLRFVVAVVIPSTFMGIALFVAWLTEAKPVWVQVLFWAAQIVFLLTVVVFPLYESAKEFLDRFYAEPIELTEEQEAEQNRRIVIENMHWKLIWPISWSYYISFSVAGFIFISWNGSDDVKSFHLATATLTLVAVGCLMFVALKRVQDYLHSQEQR